MLAHLHIQASTDAPRHAAIERVKDAVSEASGVILDASLFSNKALRLNVELEPASLAAFAHALDATDVHLSDYSLHELVRASELPAGTCVVLLFHLTFLHAEPDLAIEVPAVPG